ncbi:hypothetical protein [Phenylobacterium sp.]|uniref:hypothetical protein n=1 Tax=Phenylobacterium sp. TaxID=1871053 RepID=UPI0030F44A40
MISLLLALAAAPPVEGEHATLQACEMTGGGWVCHYTIPAVTLVGAANAPPPRITLAPAPASASPQVPQPRAEDAAEAARQVKLIADCADAGWMSLCLPKDRREARRLRDAATARKALRTQVTQLLSENKCSEAVKSALKAGDLTLAREAQAFCAP